MFELADVFSPQNIHCSSYANSTAVAAVSSVFHSIYQSIYQPELHYWMKQIITNTLSKTFRDLIVFLSHFSGLRTKGWLLWAYEVQQYRYWSVKYFCLLRREHHISLLVQTRMISEGGYRGGGRGKMVLWDDWILIILSFLLLFSPPRSYTFPPAKTHTPNPPASLL